MMGIKSQEPTCGEENPVKLGLPIRREPRQTESGIQQMHVRGQYQTEQHIGINSIMSLNGTRRYDNQRTRPDRLLLRVPLLGRVPRPHPHLYRIICKCGKGGQSCASLAFKPNASSAASNAASRKMLGGIDANIGCYQPIKR